MNRSSRCVPKTMIDHNNDFRLHQSSPSGSAFKFSGAKRMLLQAPETHLNRQEIVYLAKINDILDNIFTGGLEMSNLMTGISSHASTQPYVYYISAPKPWDPDAPHRLLTFYSRQFDKWMKSRRNLLAAPISTQRSQLCFFLLLLLLHLKFELVHL